MPLFYDAFYLECAKLAEEGKSLDDIAKRFKVSRALLVAWLMDNKPLGDAYHYGAKRSAKNYWKLRTKKLTLNQRRFLGFYRQTFDISRACELTPWTRSAHYVALQNSDVTDNDSYAAVFNEIVDLEWNDKIRAESFRRAVHGVERFRFQQGRLLEVRCEPWEEGAHKVTDKHGNEFYVKPYKEREFSDTILCRLIPQLPEFRDRDKEVAEAGSTQVNVDLAKLTEEMEAKRSNRITMDDVDAVANRIANQHKSNGKHK